MNLPLQAKEGVILLHGMCRSGSSMNEMASQLISAAYSVLNLDYPSRSNKIEILSEDAIGRALANPEISKCQKVHFVTHSLGGILVRSFLSRHTIKRLGRVVMLGPPNKGSEVVDRLGNLWIFKKINGPAGSELGTGNHSTPNALGPVNFELGVIAGDLSINWINSMMINGKDDGKVSVESTKVDGMKEHFVMRVSHPFMMSNSQVIRKTIQFLAHGSFAL